VMSIDCIARNGATRCVHRTPVESTIRANSSGVYARRTDAAPSSTATREKNGATNARNSPSGSQCRTGSIRMNLRHDRPRLTMSAASSPSVR